MGKWVEVRCNCPNRVPRRLDPSRPWDLTYDCGHRDGVLFQFWPGYLYQTACFLKSLLKDYPDVWRSFEVFSKLEQWPRGDECLEITADEAVGFQLELEELQKLENGTSTLPYQVIRKWRDHWNRFFDDPWHMEDAKSISEIVTSGLKLCEFAIETGNPIEFRW
jgi:hypothetical protein